MNTQHTSTVAENLDSSLLAVDPFVFGDPTPAVEATDFCPVGLADENPWDELTPEELIAFEIESLEWEADRARNEAAALRAKHFPVGPGTAA